jgi:hypothetical protein
VITRPSTSAVAAPNGGLAVRRLHGGGDPAARSVLDVGADVHVRTLAQHIINEQAAENDAMQARPAPPPPG